MSMSVDAIGLDALRASLAKASSTVEHAITSFIDGGLTQAKRTMQDATPVKTGALRDDWHIRAVGIRARALTNEKPYAASVMFGAHAHAIPGAFGYPAPFGTSPTFHPGNRANTDMLAAMDESTLKLREDWGKEGSRIAFALVHGKQP